MNPAAHGHPFEAAIQYGLIMPVVPFKGDESCYDLTLLVNAKDGVI